MPKEWGFWRSNWSKRQFHANRVLASKTMREVWCNQAGKKSSPHFIRLMDSKFKASRSLRGSGIGGKVRDERAREHWQMRPRLWEVYSTLSNGGQVSKEENPRAEQTRMNRLQLNQKSSTEWQWTSQVSYMSRESPIMHIITRGFFFSFCLFRAVPVVYGGSQARSQIGAVAVYLHQSHSNAGSLTHWARPGIEPASSWMLVRFVSTEPQWELRGFFSPAIKRSQNASPSCLRGGFWKIWTSKLLS